MQKIDHHTRLFELSTLSLIFFGIQGSLSHVDITHVCLSHFLTNLYRFWANVLSVFTCYVSLVIGFEKSLTPDLNQVGHGQLAEALPLIHTGCCFVNNCGGFIFHSWPNIDFNSIVQRNTEDRIQADPTFDAMGVAVPPSWFLKFSFHFISYHINLTLYRANDWVF